MTDAIRLQKGDSEEVVLGFCGRLSGENAEAVSGEIERLRGENSAGHLVFDFEELTYISSAGLRVLLRALKREGKDGITIRNVSPDVYEILETTGFTQMFETQKALKRYSLEGARLIGQGGSGSVYRVDRETIIKVFPEGTPLELIERERHLAKEALVAGIPTAISYSVVRADERYGILFELIDAGTLAEAMTSRPEKYDAYMDKYVQLLKTIHSTQGNPEAVPRTKKIYTMAIDACEDWYSAGELNKLRALVASIPEADTLIHGDFHPTNIMVSGDELILIDMGDMSVGHPVFDMAAIATSQINLVNLDPVFAEQHARMPAALIIRTWRRLIDQYFSDKTEAERKVIEEQVCLLAKLKVGLCPYFAVGAPPEILQASMNDARANFLPRIESLIGTINW